MRFKAVIFDLDGTLLNTLGDLADAVNAALAGRGYPLRTEEEVRSFVGNGIRRLMERAIPPQHIGDTDACLADFQAYYDTHMMERTVPYNGVPPLLTALQARSIALAVLSNKYDPAAKALTRHFFGDMFSITIGERQSVPRKPDPAAVFEIMNALDTDKTNTLYVGDSGVDMQTAKNAGLFAAGVTWGFRPSKVLSENGADALIDHPEDILKLLEE